MGDHQGDGDPRDGEGPVREVFVDGFSMDATTVTNADFSRFVEATGYVTEAEGFGYSAVFHLLVEAGPGDIVGAPREVPWWRGVRGADWRHPGGRRSTIRGRESHPVVHVSWNDAQAYCRWADRVLPAEAQWERAARAGRDGLRYPWGDDLPTEPWVCNIWQGTFPSVNTREDGHVGPAPVRSYPPNDWGLFEMVGNVWEWCSDWFSPAATARVMRGGSYLCHDSYCNRYRNSARTANTPDSSAGNIGFRTVGRASASVPH